MSGTVSQEKPLLCHTEGTVNLNALVIVEHSVRMATGTSDGFCNLRASGCTVISRSRWQLQTPNSSFAA